MRQALISQLSCAREQLRQSNQVVGRQSEGEGRANLGQAAQLDLGQAADALAPADDFLNPLARELTDGVAGMAGDALVGCGLARLGAKGLSGQTRS